MDRLLDYFTNHPLLAGAFVVMTFVVIAYELRQRGVSTASVAPNDAIRLVNGGALLVDLRSPNRFKDGHIAGARNVPGDQLLADPKALGKHGNKPVVLYCEDGAATAAAIRTLSRAGIANVRGLRGGLAAWKQENLPLVKG